MRDEMKIELVGGHTNIRYQVVIFAQHTFFDNLINLKVLTVCVECANKHCAGFIGIDLDVQCRIINAISTNDSVVFGVVVSFVDHFINEVTVE